MMRRTIFSLIWISLFCHNSLAKYYVLPNRGPTDETEGLFLTPYIDSDRIEEAQKLAIVPPILKNDKSFAGFLTVNKTYNSNIYFWLMTSLRGKWDERPLIVWLHGGPGVSGAAAFFQEIGIYFLDKNLKLRRRKHTWNREYNVLYIDFPVHSGYSFTDSTAGLSRTLPEAVKDLHAALDQFFKLFPVLAGNRIFISGQSWGGRVATVLALEILKANRKSTTKLNISGLISISAFSDSLSFTRQSSQLYGALGLIDHNQLLRLAQQEEAARADYRAGDIAGASGKMLTELLEIKNITGFWHLLDFVHDKLGASSDVRFMQLLNQTAYRKAMHVGNRKFRTCSEVQALMKDDTLRPVKSQAEELLDYGSLPILNLAGQLDIVSAYPMHEAAFDTLKWWGASEFRTAKRCQFKVEGRVAGYYRTIGNFTEVLVRNTGHTVPLSQPKWTLRILDAFVEHGPLTECT